MRLLLALVVGVVVGIAVYIHATQLSLSDVAIQQEAPVRVLFVGRR